ncbi:MAG TPA: response regulator [Acetobacteraceae bacterium]|jgi:CheY-like chemotaxis protein|nr:response regulator [Acetobacteraceae bacterium]
MSALKKILVVDDDPVIGKSFDRVLSRKGYNVINAANGDEALHKLASEEYDAVFTDIRMPGMSGLEVAEHVRARRPWTPVVIITGYGSAENEARARAAGVSAFLRKPLSPEMIARSAAVAMGEASAGLASIARTAAVDPAAPAVEATVEAPFGSPWKNVAMMVAAPFAMLAFVVLLPFVGLAALACTGLEAWRRRHAATDRVCRRIATAATRVGLFLAAPFITLAYIGLFPFIGMVLLARTAAEAWHRRHETA